MSGIAVTGLQWGDEGKGKIIDTLAADAEVVVRYQGGANAGHTLQVGEQHLVLHLVPSGVLYPGKTCLIGNGVAVDLAALIEELEKLENQGIETERVFLSDRAHLVFPFHKLLDEAREAAKADAKIGTTKRGIGPCYADKASRTGIRVVELFDKNHFHKRLRQLCTEKNALLQHVYQRDTVNFEELYESHLGLAEIIRDRVTDTGLMLQNYGRQRARILFEGAQGAMLDVDHGTYPYVTSSNSSACGIPSGAGLPPTIVTNSIGVMKAYSTRVGAGPFPTEMAGKDHDSLQQAGKEFGATTHRPRRCGHLDMLQIRYAVGLGGMTGIALTKLDILSQVSELKIAVAYDIDGQIITDFPADTEALARAKPIYRSMPSFDEDIQGVRALEDLPAQARQYIEFIEANAGIPVVILSIGPGRDQLFKRGHGECLWSR